MNRLALRLLSIVAIFMVVIEGAHAINRVFVKPEASDEYLIERARNPDKRVQTYQFMKGKYHSGDRLDSSMEKLTFQELAYDLALQLRKQDFYPEPVLGESDMLIVVHYGSTGNPDDFKRFKGMGAPRIEYYDELGDYSRPVGLEGYHNSQLFHVRDDSYRAKLLGMDFDRTWPSDKRLLSRLSNESRYFVILYAYDFQLLQKGKLKLLWRTRYSIRAIGQSFGDAITHMNRIASDYVGQSMKAFVQKRPDDSSFVSYGEIEVIDIEEIKAEDKNKDFLNYDLPDTPKELREPLF